jgi:hypothetical protein
LLALEWILRTPLIASPPFVWRWRSRFEHRRKENIKNERKKESNKRRSEEEIKERNQARKNKLKGKQPRKFIQRITYNSPAAEAVAWKVGSKCSGLTGDCWTGGAWTVFVAEGEVLALEGFAV